jgi:hypothetical protein
MRKSIERMVLVHDFLKRAFSGSLHAKRILSLADGTLGVLTGASLAVSVIGHALAQARGLSDRHAIKQVDRLLSNAGVVVWDLFALSSRGRGPAQGDRRGDGLDRFRRIKPRSP